MFKIIESPAPCEVRSLIRFCRQETCLLQTFAGRVVKFTEILPCLKAKCVGSWRPCFGIGMVFCWSTSCNAGTTINAVAYGQTLRKQRRAIQNKRRGMLTEGILLLHDNARSHTAAQTQALLDSFGWKVLDPPTALTLRRAILIFSTVSNIIWAATTTTMTKTLKQP
ncbi:hypothetical protein AVEN_242065-1 [Araneus ventricosus]|uniref:Histone-lysine N-methyltransferase SETMAR n=1 Tax=Araneus ventricosus TaxID=182803 RepID=A0A4Y2FH94_ARAVE|nr:hypothetical protein AVEN_242065-1 [Araneus ventricosus]